MAWTLVAADLNGAPRGEIVNAKDRALSWRLNGIPSCSFKVGLDNPMAEALLGGDVILKAYDGPTLQGIFDVASAEEVADGQPSDGIAVVGEGPFGRLGAGGDTPGRLIGKSTAGYSASGDRGAIMAAMINQTNAERDTGITVGTIAASSSDTAGPWYYRPIGEAIAELAAAMDGPDFQVVPLEPQANGGKVGRFDAAPVLGTLRDELYFEYGTGKRNMRSFRRPVDRRGILNRAHALPAGFPEATAGTVATAQDTASQAARGLREGVISSDISDYYLRQFLCEEHVRIRALPRQQIIFESHIPDPDEPDRVPVFLRDYDIGDVVRGRAVAGGELRFDAFFRVYSVSLAISDVGTVTPTLGLLPEGQS